MECLLQSWKEDVGVVWGVLLSWLNKELRQFSGCPEITPEQRSRLLRRA